MEKAEVLEAAVVYLREKRYRTSQILSFRRYGYDACAEMILRRLATVTSSGDPVYHRVKQFLQDRCTKGLMASQLSTHSTANEISTLKTNQGPSSSTISNVSSSENITIPLTTNNSVATTVAPGNSSLIPSMNHIVHSSFPTTNPPIWRPWKNINDN